MTVVLTVSAILFGVLAYMLLPVNDLPAVDYPVIQVNCGYPGASPETVASTIATPLERQFMQINGLQLITSKSSQGNCQLTLQFDLNGNETNDGTHSFFFNTENQLTNITVTGAWKIEFVYDGIGRRRIAIRSRLGRQWGWPRPRSSSRAGISRRARSDPRAT